MNKRLIFKIIGIIMLIEAALMLLPMIVGLIYNEKDWIIFLYSALMIGAAGGLLVLLMKPKKTGLFVSDGFIITAGAWLALSALGAIPFCLGGLLPNYIDALFESISGFTTTGISMLPDVEAASHCMIFWRALTNWIGGMGVLVFMLALAPVAGGASIHLYKAESPGPISEKFTSKISTGAKYLYYLYIALTFAQIIALCISGLSFYNSVIVTFGTVATGGYMYLNTSLASFTVAQQIIVDVFMFISGTSFGYLFLMITGKAGKARKNTEVKVYLAIVIIAIAFITYNVYSYGIYDTFGEALNHSAFGTISAMTTTGFSSTDMNIWPWFSKVILVLLMFIGGCAGSTAGGIKVSRIVIMMKALKNYLKELAHPRSVSDVKFNDRKVNDSLIKSTLVYICMIVVISAFSMIIVSQDPKIDLVASLTSVATTINNIGIELKGSLGGSFLTYEWYSKIVFMLDMLIGRLEIFPIMILITYIGGSFGKLIKRTGSRTVRH